MSQLLDTNIVIGLLTGTPEAVDAFRASGTPISDCAVSFVTRLEVLGWPGMTDEAERVARAFLDGLVTLHYSDEIEHAVIDLRRVRKIKLPDALIAATAKVHRLPLVSLDQDLLAAIRDTPPPA